MTDVIVELFDSEGRGVKRQASSEKRKAKSKKRKARSEKQEGKSKKGKARREKQEASLCACASVVTSGRHLQCLQHEISPDTAHFFHLSAGFDRRGYGCVQQAADTV
jgi:hypothetical protein